jgi:DinB superfamily
MSDWIQDFRNTVEVSSERLRRIDDEQAALPLKDDTWSAKEVLGHLIDSAANNHARFVLAQIKDDLVFSGYEQDRWVELQNYQTSSWRQLVDLWSAYNLHLAHVMSCASDEKLNQPRPQHTLQVIAFEAVKETEPTTLKYLMTDYVAHLKHHLSQILGEASA